MMRVVHKVPGGMTMLDCEPAGGREASGPEPNRKIRQRSSAWWPTIPVLHRICFKHTAYHPTTGVLLPFEAEDSFQRLQLLHICWNGCSALLVPNARDQRLRQPRMASNSNAELVTSGV